MKKRYNLSFGNPPSPTQGRFWLRIIIMTIAIMITGQILSGVYIGSFLTALITAIVISLLNIWIRPLLLALAVPFIVLSMGFVVLLINALIIQITSWIVPDFGIKNFGVAFLFSLIVSFITLVIETLDKIFVIQRQIKKGQNQMNDLFFGQEEKTSKEDNGFTSYEDVSDKEDEEKRPE